MPSRKNLSHDREEGRLPALSRVVVRHAGSGVLLVVECGQFDPPTRSDVGSLATEAEVPLDAPVPAVACAVPRRLTEVRPLHEVVAVEGLQPPAVSPDGEPDVPGVVIVTLARRTLPPRGHMFVRHGHRDAGGK
jgi:hypothetical protein